MKDYVPTKGKYVIPKAVWNRTLWLIRDYDRMKLEADVILTSFGGSIIAAGGTSGVSDPVARKAILRSNYLEAIRAIERSLEDIPECYRKGIWNSIQHRDRYPLDADRTTYSRYKQRYIERVAEAMHYI